MVKVARIVAITPIDAIRGPKMPNIAKTKVNENIKKESSTKCLKTNAIKRLVIANTNNARQAPLSLSDLFPGRSVAEINNVPVPMETAAVGNPIAKKIAKGITIVIVLRNASETS